MSLNKLVKKCNKNSLFREINSEKKIIFSELIVANNFFTRFKGLLGKKGLSENEGLLICSCNQVHTIGMRFTIDTVFIGKNKEVLKVVSHLKPYRQAYAKGGRYVLEIKAGMAQKHNVQIGDVFTW